MGRELEYASLNDMKDWARGIMQRAPDFVIGDNYLRRWWVIPRNEGCNIYLHEITKSDEDRAGHTHPWNNTSYLIEGEYVEVVYSRQTPWAELDRFHRKAGDIVERTADHCHRLIVPEGGRAVSLFITGPKIQEWGFWCAEGERFVHWTDFVDMTDSGKVGRGCGEN